MSYASDEEQLEAIKRWWAENGRAVIAGVVIAIGGVAGWHQWNSYQQARAEQASAAYLSFLEQVETAAAEAVEQGRSLIDDYASTPYATLTAFWLARHQAQQGEHEAAAEHLRWVLDNSGNDGMRHIARLRLGRLLLGAGQHEEALAVLRTRGEAGFGSQYQELRGDIHAARGERDAAVSAYRNALKDNDISSQRRSIIQLKLGDLGAAAEEPIS